MDHVRAVLEDAEIRSACTLVLVSFVKDGAKEWQETAGVKEDDRVLILVDDEREVYNRFGLGRGLMTSFQ